MMLKSRLSQTKWGVFWKMIKVITQNTAEREAEIIDLFNRIQPLLDQGCIYTKALKIVLHIPAEKEYRFTGRAWFRDLIQYGETQGYPFEVYSGKGKIPPKTGGS